MSTTDVLDVDDLTVEYGGATVVDGVSLTVRPGELVAVVGESGSGKTTFVRAATGLVGPAARWTANRLALCGHDLLALDERARLRVYGAEVGFVFQNPHAALNPVLTVGRQGTEMLRRHRSLSRREAIDRFCSIMSEVGIGRPRSWLATYPHQLSGGMAQRIAIAIAVSCGPRLLVADEPTASLDATVAAQVLELITQLREQSALGVVLVTHNLAQAGSVADRLAVMYAGRLVETGPPAEVVRRPRMPYTSALLAAAPALGRPAGTRLVGIPGRPPHPGEFGDGCAFRPRCPAATDACLAPPGLTDAAPGHAVRCWHPLTEVGR